MNRSMMQALECRMLLAAAAPGVPADVTSVGANVYFAQNGLTRLDTRTGTRASIVRADGTSFGNNSITLSGAAGRLFISEQVQRKTDYPEYKPALFDLWSVADGSARATRLLVGSQRSMPADIATANGVTYFSVTNPNNGSDFYGINAQQTSAFRAVDSNRADLGSILVDAVPWGSRRIAVQTQTTGFKFFSYDIRRRTYTKLSTTGLPDAQQWGLGNLHVVGDSLMVTAQRYGSIESRIFYLAGGATSWSPYALIAGADNTRLLGVAGNRAILFADNGGNDKKILYTDFTEPDTLELQPAADDYNRAGMATGDANYFVHNGSLFASTALTLSLSQSYPNANEFFKWDLATGARTTLAYSRDVGEFSAGSFVPAGKLVYFRRTFYSTAKSVTLGELWQTDGTNAGTVRISAAVAGPVIAGGYVLYTPKSTSTTLITPATPLLGGIEGRVVRDDGRVDDLTTLSTAMPGFTVFLDRNNNRRLDVGELSKSTDAAGHYVFNNLAPGNYRVRIADLQDFTTTHGSAPRLEVVAGHGASFDFGLADEIVGPVSGRIYGPGDYALNFESIWLDYDRDGRRDHGEPRYGIWNGEFDFTAAGLKSTYGLQTYRVGVWTRKYFFELSVPAAGSTTIKLTAST